MLSLPRDGSAYCHWRKIDKLEMTGNGVQCHGVASDYSVTIEARESSDSKNVGRPGQQATPFMRAAPCVPLGW